MPNRYGFVQKLPFFKKLAGDHQLLSSAKPDTSEQVSRTAPRRRNPRVGQSHSGEAVPIS